MKIIGSILIFVLLILILYYFIPSQRFPPNIVIDKLVVFKSKRQLCAYSNGKCIKLYKIALGFNPTGKKQIQNDGKTPEGLYKINNKNIHSICYKNLGISYPNQEDIDNAKKLGKATGGNVKIHGLYNGSFLLGKFHCWSDWTRGCVAVTNSEMDELYSHTPIGTPIEILP